MDYFGNANKNANTSKVYVEVNSDYARDGNVLLRSFVWEDGVPRQTHEWNHLACSESQESQGFARSQK